MDDEQLDEELAALEADSHIEERDEGLGIGIDIGTETEFEADGFTYTIRPAEQSDLSSLVGTMRSVAEEQDYFVAETAVDLLDQEQVIFRNNDIKSGCSSSPPSTTRPSGGCTSSPRTTRSSRTRPN